MELPTTPNFLHISSTANAHLPLLDLILIGEGAERAVEMLYQISEDKLEENERGWRGISTTKARWRVTTTLCGVSSSSVYVWAINPIDLCTSGVSKYEKDAVYLLKKVGLHLGFVWLLPSNRLSIVEVFSAQTKVRDLLTRAQFPRVNQCSIILPNYDVREVNRQLDLMAVDYLLSKRDEAEASKRDEAEASKRDEAEASKRDEAEASKRDEAEASKRDGDSKKNINQLIPLSKKRPKWPRIYLDALIPIQKGECIGVDDQRWKVDASFLIGQTLVTQGLYSKVLSHSKSLTLGLRYPVVGVSWLEAIYFCNTLSSLMNLTPYYQWMSTKSQLALNPLMTFDDLRSGLDDGELIIVISDPQGVGFRLPTSTEWCYAATADEAYPYAGGEDPQELAWSAHNSGSKVHPVATLQPNKWGLYDCSGNLWEWCQDGPSDHSLNVLCSSNHHPKWLLGGSWANHPWVFPLGERLSEYPTYQDSFMGFRLVRNIKEIDEQSQLDQLIEEVKEISEEVKGISEKITEISEEVTENPKVKEQEEIKETSAELAENLKDTKEISEKITEIPKEMREISEEVTEIPKEMREISEEVTEIPEEVTEIPEEITEIPEEVTEVPEEITEVPKGRGGTNSNSDER